MKRFRLFHAAITLASLILTASIIEPAALAQDNSVIADEQIDPQRLAAARKFLEVSDFEQQMSKMLQSMKPMLEQGINTFAEAQGADQLSPKQREEFRKISKLVSDAFTDKFLEKQRELTELTTLVYARAMTVEEINALTEFQKSPTGRKYNEAGPEIVTVIMSKIMTGMTTDYLVASSDALDPEKERAIKEMLEISQFDRMIDLMLENMAQSKPVGVMQPDLSTQQLEEIDAVLKAKIKKFKLSKQELNEFVVSFWGKKLEIEDINATTDFYKTEIGQKILTSMPKIYEEQHKLEEKMFMVMFSDMDTMVQEIISKYQSQQ